MEEWRGVADRARTSLLVLAHGPRSPDQFLSFADAAFRKLATAVHITRGMLEGHLDLQAIPEPPVDGYDYDYDTPTLIELARLQLDRLGGEHAMVGNVFNLYRARLGLIPGGTLWGLWELHHASGLRNACAAMEALHAAAASHRAGADAYGVATTFPHNSQGWVAWMSAAERLMTAAAVAADSAARRVTQMRLDVHWQDRSASAALAR